MFDYLNKKPLSYELTVLKKKKNKTTSMFYK